MRGNLLRCFSGRPACAAAALICFPLFLLAGRASAAAAAYVEPPRHGIGLYKLIEGWGAGFMTDVNKRVSLHAVAGPFGDLHVYSGRVLYRYLLGMDWSLYGFAQAAFYRYEPDAHTGENTSGFAGGLGVEYDLRRDFPGSLPVVLSAEIGAGTGELESREISGAGFGMGVNFRF